ncbi:MAG TPA: SDR family oxidoreductase [Baekduia sp.]|nr:SDR family oxidoreductase [Baekduia sp.]
MGNRLESKVVTVTGGVRGIGRGIVELFLDEGAAVVVGDINEDGGRELEAELATDRVAFIRADVTSAADIEAMIAFCVGRFGRLDGLVNNAGALGDQAALVDLDPDGFSATVDLLTRSAALGHKYAARQMIEQGDGGSIVSLSSIAGLQAGWSAVSYDLAKAAVTHLARSATYELAPHGIRSNVICPGLILTPIIATSASIPPEQYDAFTESLAEPFGAITPLRHAGRPRDIAEAALYFIGDGSTHVTGQTLTVDGGLTSVTGFDIAGAVGQAVEAFTARVGGDGAGDMAWLPTRHEG